MIIREIQQHDNAAIEHIIKATLLEFGLPMLGTVYEDQEIIRMYESYQLENEIYYVIENEGEILGGGGIKHLKDFDNDVCELQKMYLLPKARGKGYGNLLFNKCLDAAKQKGYKKCYLESASQLKVAIQIYENAGFNHLDKPLGNTGHFSCGVWMIKDLV
jgi:putative acetyltransferase